MHYSACCNLDLGQLGRRRLTTSAWHASVVEERYLLRRIAVMPLLLLGIVTIAFVISRLMPADPLVSIVGERQLNNEGSSPPPRRGGVSTSAARAVRHLREEPRQGRPRHVVPHPPSRSRRPARPPAGDARAHAAGALLIGVVGGVALGGVAARKTQQAHRPRQPLVLRCSARRCRCSGSGWCCCSIFYAAARLAPGPGRLASARRRTRSRSPASTPSTRCSTATSRRSGQCALATSCCRRRARLGRHGASCHGWCGPAMLDEFLRLRAHGAGEGAAPSGWSCAATRCATRCSRRSRSSASRSPT